MANALTQQVRASYQPEEAVSNQVVQRNVKLIPIYAVDCKCTPRVYDVDYIGPGLDAVTGPNIVHNDICDLHKVQRKIRKVREV